ncbi:hypothetical protein BDN72DRAFT_838816 [Pluteus cervinus]|uniref:Uncharacterized protein n=1 Tax=Pluteus cervinus TaxID=181527 RepID=A0ACD3AXM1_9AGAR|nr:hypothetical protein BDN72DRAFT_838816 [Pluteus cervinus]
MKLFPDSRMLEFSRPFEIHYPSDFEEKVLAVSKSTRFTAKKREDVLKRAFDHPSLDLESIFHHVRDSGEVLPSSTFASIQEFVQTCQDDISALTSSISDNLNMISELCLGISRASGQLLHTQDRLELGQYLLLGARSHLPDDILGHIFVLCMEDNETLRPHPMNAPLKLASVCHQWRVLVHSIPSLWGKVLVDTEQISSIKLAKEWIERCHVLSLTLNYSHVSFLPKMSKKRKDKRGSSATQAKFDGLVKLVQSSRISLRQLSAHFTLREDSLKVLPLLLKGHEGELEELVFPDEYCPTGLEDYPKLHRLYFSRVPNAWCLEFSSPPAGLTLLVVGCKVHRRVLDMLLSQCPRLQSLYVRLSDSGRTTKFKLRSESAEHKPRSIIHHNLTYLAIADGCISLPSEFLAQFDLSAISIFEYYLEGHFQNRRGGPDYDSEIDQYESDELDHIDIQPRSRHFGPLQPPVMAMAGKIEWLLTHPVLHQIRRLTLDVGCTMTRTDFVTLISLARSVEELCITCDFDALKEIIGVLTAIPALVGSTTVAGNHILPSLKRLNLIPMLSVRRMTEMKEELRWLIRAWSSTGTSAQPNLPVADSGKKVETSTISPVHQLAQLDLTFRRGDIEDEDYLLSFQDDLHKVNPHLSIRILKQQDYSKEATSDTIPKSFEVYPLKFSMDEVRKYEVYGLDPDYDADDAKSEQGNGYDFFTNLGSTYRVESQVFGRGRR